MVCKLTDYSVIIAPHDAGSPPAWVPYIPSTKVVWVDRATFDALKMRRYTKPCDICPDEVKKWCDDEEKV